MPKILVVDDLPALRQHVVALVQTKVTNDIQVQEAANGAEAVKLFRIFKPDLVIMDIVMPELNGIKAAEAMWKENAAAKILFWSQFHREAYVRELGKIVPDEAIHGYALKSESDEKLIYALNSLLLHDNPYIDPVVRNVQSKIKGNDASFTEIDYEIFVDVLLGLTDKVIAMRRHISVRGVQNRLAMLAGKLFSGAQDEIKDCAGMEVYNPRTRVVFEALKRGLIDLDLLPELQKDLDEWLCDQFDINQEPLKPLN